MTFWHQTHSGECFFQLSIRGLTLFFHCWKSNRGLRLSGNIRTPENDHLHIYSLWASLIPSYVLMFSWTFWFLIRLACEESLLFFYWKTSIFVFQVTALRLACLPVNQCEFAGCQPFSLVSSIPRNESWNRPNRYFPFVDCFLLPCFGSRVVNLAFTRK